MMKLQTKIFLSAMVQDSKRRNKKNPVNSINPTTKVKSQVSLKKNEVSFDFTYTEWLKTVKLGKFTNKLKNPQEFAELIYIIMNKVIPFITDNWVWIKHNVYPHAGHNCHPVTDEKIELVKEIIRNTHSVDLEPMIDNGEEKVLWQLGHQGAVRLVVYYMASSKTFYPLFVDYHHLIHPVKGDRRSQTKHNDYKNKDWCPVESFK